MTLIQAGYPDTEVNSIEQAQSIIVYRYKSSRDSKAAIAARRARRYSFTARVIDEVNNKFYVLEIVGTLIKQLKIPKEN